MSRVLWGIALAALVALGGIVAYPVGYFIFEENHASALLLPNEQPEVIAQSVGAYLINLDRSPDRLAHAQPLVEALSMPNVRVSAVDGHKIPERILETMVDESQYLLTQKQPIKLGDVGCYLSHVQVWQSLLASSYEYGLVFEDDVAFNPVEVNNAVQALLKNPSFWDVVVLDKAFSDEATLTPVQSFENGNKVSVIQSGFEGSSAYLISRYAAEALLKKSLPIKTNFDGLMARPWEFDVTLLALSPELVQDRSLPSVIKASGGVQSSPEIQTSSVEAWRYAIQTRLARWVSQLERTQVLKRQSGWQG